MAILNFTLEIPDAAVPTVGEAVCAAAGKTCADGPAQVLAFYELIERWLVQTTSQYYQDKQANAARETAKQQAEAMLVIGYPGKVTP